MLFPCAKNFLMPLLHPSRNLSMQSQSTVVLGSGLNGLVGSKIVSELKELFTFENLDLSSKINPTDITNSEQVARSIGSSDAECFVHCAAFTDVSAAWAERDNKDGLAYRVNVLGTQNVARACAKYNKHLVHLSTAYVFDGTNPEPYTEQDSPNPIEWYGQTKWLAEQAVQELATDWTILRIDQPFRSDTHSKADIVRKITAGLLAGTAPPFFTNHWFGPTYIDDLAHIIQWALKSKTTGLFHASSGEMWTDYDFAQEIAQLLGVTEQVRAGDLDAYLATSQRPYQRNTALNTSALQQVITQYQPTPITAALAQAVSASKPQSA